MDRRQLLQLIAGAPFVSDFNASAETLELDNPFILVIKVPGTLSSFSMRMIDEKFDEWKIANNITVPHIVITDAMSIELVRKEDVDK